MKSFSRLAAVGILLVLGCEDGPEQIFVPVDPGNVPIEGGGAWTLTTWTRTAIQSQRRAFGAGNASGETALGAHDSVMKKKQRLKSVRWFPRP